MKGKMNYQLIEEIARAVVADGEECDIATVERLFESLDETGQEWLASAREDEVFEWAVSVLINTQPPLGYQM